MSYDAGALIFKIQTAGQETFGSDMARADQAVDKLGRTSANAKTKVDGVGDATDKTGKKAREAKGPLDEQAKSTKKVGDDSEDAAKKQERQAVSSERQVAAAKELSAAMLITGTAVTAVVALSVAKYAEFDQAMSLTRAATMATREEQEALAESALEAGADTAYSASEAAAAQEELAKAGQSVADIVGGSLNGALALAAAGQLQVARSAEIMATTLKQYSLPAEQAAHVSDLLAAGAGKAMGSVDDLANGLKFVGPVAASMGVSLEETVGVLALFADQGIIGEQAGTSFRGMLSSLTSPSAIAARTLAEYNVQLFDGNGKMKSAASIAEELHTAFNGLTDAERSAALGRIFGNEQITAATVLMRAGAEGVDTYTASVNDAGYAAEQARLKQDNLAGDVEKLGGAFDTALIQTGSGANDVLREMTQQATALVDVYGELPTPVHNVALAGGVAVGAMTLLAGAAVSGRAKFMELKAAFDDTGTSMRKTAMIGAAAGVALTGILMVVSVLASKQAEMNAATSEFADSLDDATGAATAYTRELIAKKLADAGAFEEAQKAGVSQKELTDALYEGGDAYEAVMSKLRAAHDAQGLFGAGLGNTINTLSDTNVQLEDAKTRHDDLKAATEGSSGATDTSTESTLSAGEAWLETAGAVDGLEDTLGNLIDKMMEANGAQLDAREANRKYLDALDEFDAALKENGNTLDLNTEAGRENEANLDAIAEAAMNTAAKTTEAGGGYDQYRASLEGSRQALLDRIDDLGISGDEAQALADKILRIPPETEWQVFAETSAAAQKAQQFIDLINRIPAGKTITLGTVVGGAGALLQADGGKVEFYANGGHHENHIAQFARAGTYRVWAEDETGGEWYLPHSPAKRERSLQIAEQMLGEWGYDMVPQGSGGPATAPGAATGPTPRMSLDGVVLRLDVDGRQITGVIREEAAGVVKEAFTGRSR